MKIRAAFVLCLLAASVAASAGRWIEIPDTRMRAVCPNELVPPSTKSCAEVVNGWSGGVFDPNGNRMFVLGGGHNGYYGNEVYEFDLDTKQWTRLTDPTEPLPDADTVCYSTWDNGVTPTSRHTHNHLAWIGHQDRFALYGGGTACRPGHTLQDMWTFDPDTATWDRLRRRSPIRDNHIQLVYDPATRKLFAKKNNRAEQTLFSFDLSRNRYTRVATGVDTGSMLARTGTLDTKRHQIWFVGGGTVSTLLLHPPYTLTIHSTKGGDAIVSSGTPGVAYDPVRDRIVAWCSSDKRCGHAKASEVYILNPETKIWRVDRPNGSSPPRNTGARGVHGRWRYSPKDDVFIAVNSVDSNVWLYRPD